MSRRLFMFGAGLALGGCIAEIIRVALGYRLDETSSITWLAVTAVWVILAVSFRARLGRLHADCRAAHLASGVRVRCRASPAQQAPARLQMGDRRG